MSFTYRAYGLTIRVPFACPALTPADEGTWQAGVDIVVRESQVPRRLPAPRAADESWDASPGSFLLRGGRRAGRFLIEAGTVVFERNPGCDDAMLAQHFTGQVLAALLRLRGLLVLHANAVQVPGGVVVIGGDTGSGKSTTAAMLVRRGGRMLSDDVTALRPAQPRPAEPRPAELRPAELRPGELRPGEPRPAELRQDDPRPGEPRPGELRQDEPRPAEPRPGELRSAQPRPGELRQDESRPGCPPGMVEVVPGAAQTHLARDAAETLGYPVTATQLQPWRRMKAAIPTHDVMAARAGRLRAVYLLRTSARDEVLVTPVTGTEKFLALQECLYGPMFAEEHPALFPLMSAVAAGVPIFRLDRPPSRWSVGEVADAILAGAGAGAEEQSETDAPTDRAIRSGRSGRSGR